MVAVRSRLDDVLLARGKKVEATHKATLSIPGVLREDGKAKRVELDVSEEGEAELEKFKARMKKRMVEIGTEMDRFSDARREARAAKPKKKPEPPRAPDNDSPAPSADTAPTGSPAEGGGFNG